MTLFTIVARGLLRRPIRTCLTLLGISIGIAAVVALVGISRGFSDSWGNGVKSRGTSVVLSSLGSSLTPKPFDAAVAARIEHLPNVAAICPSFVDLTSVETAQLMVVSARQWDGYTWNNLKVIAGRLPQDGKEQAVVLGSTAAEVLKKKVGDPIQIETGELKVVGIVDGGAWVENGSVVLSLQVYQELTGNTGKINVIDVQAAPPADSREVQALCDTINGVVKEARAVPAGDNIGDSQAFRIVHAMSWGTSLLAVLVGVLGVMNTMLMTVFERTQEICVLLALGWKRSRIVRMVLWESALLGLLGGVVGVLLGAGGVTLLGNAPAIRGLLKPEVSLSLLATAVAISVAVGVVSGFYPAWRSSRLNPSRALQG